VLGDVVDIVKERNDSPLWLYYRVANPYLSMDERTVE